MEGILSDRPIEDPEADAFGRTSFARAIATALVLPPASPSIVVAVEGEWGSGKTSVINMAAHFLASDPANPHIVRLDSWLLAGSEAVVQSFLTQFAAALGQEDPSGRAARAAEKLLRFSRLMTPLRLIPGVEPIANIAKDILASTGESAKAYAELSRLDLQKRKEEVANALRDIDHPIVVILDDLDRLDPEETRQVFRLVKAVADFERVAYLLAYDPTPVHKALSFGDSYDGATYLEKIVQVSYPLPIPSFLGLRAYLRGRLNSLLETQNLESFERTRLEELMSTGGLAQALRHPRDANRLVNRLSISIPPTRGEVNAADVVAFEAIALRFPSVADAIRRRPFEFISGWFPHDQALAVDYLSRFLRKPDQAPEPPEWKQRILEAEPPEVRRSLIALLEFLFPGFTVDSRHAEYDERRLDAELRVCRRLPLLNLLSVGPSSGVPSARQIKQFLTEPGARDEILQDVYGSDTSDGWLTIGRKFLVRINVVDPEQLVTLLASKASELKRLSRDRARELIQEIAFFLLQLLAALPDAVAERLLKRIVRDSGSLWLSHEVVLNVAKDHRLWVHTKAITAEQDLVVKSREAAAEAIELWLAAVRERATLSMFEILQEPGSVEILFRWAQFANFEEVQEHIEALTSTAEGIEVFFEAWSPKQPPWDFDVFFRDWRAFRARCETHPRRERLREDLWHFFEYAETREHATADVSE